MIKLKNGLRVSFLMLIAMVSLGVNAQNIQVHYDFGRHLYSSEESNRQRITITYEQFKADCLGSWYYFADFDVLRDGTCGAYTEVSREFNLGKQSPFAAHLEFDGGLNRFGSFQNAILVGPAYNGHTADFSKTWSVQLMYKQTFSGAGNDGTAGVQLTGVWGVNFANSKWTFSGFADFWTGYIPEWKENGAQKKGFAFVSEPQIWYNVCKYYSIGSEWELSYNFIYPTASTTKFYVNPTIALKFNL